MNPIAAVITSPSQTLRILRTIFSDALYRGSLYLLANNVATAAIGFVFWALAAHMYSASNVGVFSSVTSGVGLLAAIAGLGLPITMTRHIARAKDSRQLVFMAVTIIATAGTVLCFATLLFLAPHLPATLHIDQHGKMTLLVTVLVVFTAASTTLDAALVAMRSSRVVLIKNLIGSIVKVVAMLLLVTFRSTGLLVSFALGLVLATMLSGIALGSQIRQKQSESSIFSMPWHYLSATSGNYLATVIGILPLSIVPIEVLAARGATETARFSVAFLIAGFLNFIPSTTGQVLFAEVARGGVPLGKQLRKALRAVYGLLLPPLTLLLVAAPLVLRLFGQAYAVDATGCLRVLALSALPAGGTYLISSLLIARDRVAAYTFMQVANAVLILGCVWLLLPRGLTAAAIGLAIAQVLTLILCLLTLPTGRIGRHHTKAGTAPVTKPSNYSQDHRQLPFNSYALKPETRELLATWPMMPSTPTAERIRSDQALQVQLCRVTESRLSYAPTYQYSSQSRYLPGATAQFSLWFPPIEIPVGLGQVRSAEQLPVLTMITGYSRWLSAILIPSKRAEDLFAGWWELMVQLGAVPHMLTSNVEDAVGWRSDGRSQVTAECKRFCRSLSTKIVVVRPGDLEDIGLIEQARAHLERSFLLGRKFSSPVDFNFQLHNWLKIDNTRCHQPPNQSPSVLIATDRRAMLPLPPIPPATGWRLPMRVGDCPFIHFENNQYSVSSALVGQTVELIADLCNVRVLHEGKIVAEHHRAWAHECIVNDPSHRNASR